MKMMPPLPLLAAVLLLRWWVAAQWCCSSAAAAFHARPMDAGDTKRGPMGNAERPFHCSSTFSFAIADTTPIFGRINSLDVKKQPVSLQQSKTQESPGGPSPSTPASSSFELLVQKAIQTLLKSDTDGDELQHSYGSASQGLWLHSTSAKEMQSVFDQIVLQFYASRRRNISNHCSSQSSSVAAVASSPANMIEFYHTSISNNDNSNETNDSEDYYHNRIKRTKVDDIEGDSFQTLLKEAFQTIIHSDLHGGGSSSQGRWVYDPAARRLQDVMDRLVINLPDDINNDNNQATSSSQNLDDEQRAQWIRWMKSSPNPLFLDLTSHIQQLVARNYNEAESEEDRWIAQDHLQFVDMTLEEYSSRIACHVILLPSGSETAPLSLVESTGAHVYGKLLYGGVTRFRLLKSGKTIRRAGENREVMIPSTKHQQHPSWVQLGGLERRYEAIDMGPAAVLELTLLPRLWQDLPTVFDKSTLLGDKRGDMVISDAAYGWNPSAMLKLIPETGCGGDDQDKNVSDEGANAFKVYEGEQRNVALRSHFQNRVGGLQSSIDAIIRRVLDGRSIYAQSMQNENNNDTINKARFEAEELASLGIQPVRGLLLYGRPGTGKTLIVREIARALGARPPKIVAASELLDRWVGGSERLVRELFHEAEEELKLCQLAAGSEEKDMAYLKSSLHVIVIDEVDAVFRARTESDDSGAITRNSVVNQLLAKIDGVRALPNVLLIAMTNRRELLDPAMLRPGRLEVQIEIAMPDKQARREILQIHFGALRRSNRLSYPLRCAIDGVKIMKSMSGDEIYGNRSGESRNVMRKRERFKSSAKNFLGPWLVRQNISLDLADDKYTGGMSGADLAGLARNAGSLALARARKDGSGVDGILVTLEDVIQALDER